MSYTDNKRGFYRKLCIFLACVLCLLAPAIYLHLVAVNSVNAPCWDDYDSLVEFLNQFRDTSSFAGRLSLILVQHNEHRLAFLRLVGLSVFYLKGDLDFRLLCYIGNAALVLIAYFLFYAFKTGGEFKPFYFSPVLFLLFQPQYHDIILQATALFSNFSVLLFALVTLLLIERRSRISFVFACVFAALAIFSQGNGILIFPMGLVAFLMQRNYRQAGIWLLVSLLVLAVYFKGYGQLPGHPGILEALMDIKGVILSLFCFAGSAAGFSSFYPSLFCGIGMVLYFIFLTIRKYYRSNPTLYFLFFFILLTIGINAVFRSWKGIEFVLLQSRYKFFSIFGVILLYLSLYEIVQRKRLHLFVAITGLIVALAFFTVSSSLYIPKVVESSEGFKRGLLRWYVDGEGLRYPFPEEASRLLNESIEKSIYKFPENIIKEFKKTPYVFRKKDIHRHPVFSIDTVAENDEYAYIDGWAFLSAEALPGEKISVVLESSEQAFAFPTVTIIRPDLVDYFGSSSLKRSGFGVLISKRMIQPGRYEVGVYTESKDDRGLSYSGEYIDVNR